MWPVLCFQRPRELKGSDLASVLLHRLVSEHQRILTALQSILAARRPPMRLPPTTLREVLEEVLRHFELEERALIPLLLGTDCSHARILASALQAEMTRLRQLLGRIGALAWNRRRANQALTEFADALRRQFETEEQGLFDEARRHRRGESTSAPSTPRL